MATLKSTVVQGNLTVSGTCAANSFATTSDERLKNIKGQFITDKTLLDLPIYVYDYKEKDAPKCQIGCLAQDLAKILPEAVSVSSEGYLTIQESKLVYLLLNDVKKLNERVEALETELKALKQDR